jgi:uncharacterized membrane protein YkvA (DUF1232 family)
MAYHGLEGGIMGFFKKLVQFIRAVAEDPRIPDRDKKVLLGLAALVVSPIDLIPDWIPVIGVLDDVIMIAIILDYLFNVLDDQILLSHYPWGMKSYVALRRFSKTVSRLTPQFIKDRIWLYKPSPY